MGEESAVTSYKGNSTEETWGDEVSLSHYLVILPRSIRLSLID